MSSTDLRDSGKGFSLVLGFSASYNAHHKSVRNVVLSPLSLAWMLRIFIATESLDVGSLLFIRVLYYLSYHCRGH